MDLPSVKPDGLTRAQALLILNALPNIGPITLNRLIAEVGDPVAVLAAPRERLEQVKGVGPAISTTLVNWREHFDLAREETRLQQASADFITPGDPGYPRLLREIHDPPIGLYRKGRYDVDAPCIAIVGSRRTTLYGQKIAKSFAAELARRGFCIVSGLARGIDTAAHEGALEAGGRTVAVLGTGIDLIYPPENLALYRQIEQSGALLTEFPFGRRADRQSFAMRNRIVAGSCEGVLVIETDVAGGSMITARFAGEQGRQLWAVPGRIDQPTSSGCHQLIRDGALLVTSVDDILNELNYLDGLRPSAIPAKASSDAAASAATSLPALEPDENAVLECLRGGAVLAPDVIAATADLPAARVSVALMMLELKSLVGRRADGRYEPR